MAHAYLPSGKNNDSNYADLSKNVTPELRRGRQLQLYLEDELVRIGEMQTRVATELVLNSDFFNSDSKCCGSYTNNLDVILAVGKDLVQAQLKLTRLYMHVGLIKKELKEEGRDETD